MYCIGKGTPFKEPAIPKMLTLMNQLSIWCCPSLYWGEIFLENTNPNYSLILTHVWLYSDFTKWTEPQVTLVFLA